jgi:ArsR family transcriptional regulator
MSAPPVTSATADTSTAADVLRVVADPVRLRILGLLGRGSLCVCHLQELDLARTLGSHHLRALRQAGLVATEPAGRFTYYRLRPGALDAVRDVVDGLAQAARGDLPRRPSARPTGSPRARRIAPASGPGFVLAQIVGGAVGLGLARALVPGPVPREVLA